MKVTTWLTEIVTGLGMLGASFRDTLPVRPGELRHVDAPTWDAVVDAWDDPATTALADAAFTNGRFFLEAADALRGRRPRLVEWAGPRRAPGDEIAPVDLRVDHVYLVSCKYLSRITVNASPSHVMDRLLTGGQGRRSTDWFSEVAPSELATLWAAVERWLGNGSAPRDLGRLDAASRRAVAKSLNFRVWPPELAGPYESLCEVVAQRSATHWTERLRAAGPGAAEAMLWRLLRIGSAPYFVLGSHGTQRPLRLRVASPWDWRQRWELRRFAVAALPGGQPMVSWHATVRHAGGSATTTVDGHVELRWSHGRFSGPPEAKVYLNTPFDMVPGYFPLA